MLALLLAAMILLFLLTFFGESGEQPPSEPVLNGELRVAQVYLSGPASERTMSVRTALRMPVNGSLTSGYGLREDPMTGEPDFHPAVDLAAPEGTPVLAAADGVVSETGWDPVYGSYVRIWHGGGLETRYGHCSELLCGVGDTVEAGGVIARVGMTGRATGYHLDFQVLVDGENVDPAPWIGLP